MHKHLIIGGSAMVAGLVAYILFMAMYLVPTTQEFAALFGMSVPSAVAWFGLTAVVIGLVLGAKRQIR